MKAKRLALTIAITAVLGTFALLGLENLLNALSLKPPRLVGLIVGFYALFAIATWHTIAIFEQLRRSSKRGKSDKAI